jgi:1,4-dihydroxy-2-naphthoyl-CoA hydrolase
MRADDLRDQFTVRLKHSDAAGVIFFPNAFHVEQEFFERWLEAGGLSLRGRLDGAHAPTPVVHCEADFRRPVRVGDRLMVRLSGVRVGRTSYTLAWSMELDGDVAIKVRVRRAAVDAARGGSTELAADLRAWLERSQQQTSSLD